MTEIYTLLLEQGPLELPSETPSSLSKTEREERDRAQITANAVNHQPQDNVLIRSKIIVFA